MPDAMVTLVELFESICVSPRKIELFSAASLMAFLGVLRISKLLCWPCWDRGDKALLVSLIALAKNFFQPEVS